MSCYKAVKNRLTIKMQVKMVPGLSYGAPPFYPMDKIYWGYAPINSNGFQHTWINITGADATFFFSRKEGSEKIFKLTENKRIAIVDELYENYCRLQDVVVDYFPIKVGVKSINKRINVFKRYTQPIVVDKQLTSWYTRN